MERRRIGSGRPESTFLLRVDLKVLLCVVVTVCVLSKYIIIWMDGVAFMLTGCTERCLIGSAWTKRRCVCIGVCVFEFEAVICGQCSISS